MIDQDFRNKGVIVRHPCDKTVRGVGDLKIYRRGVVFQIVCWAWVYTQVCGEAFAVGGGVSFGEGVRGEGVVASSSEVDADVVPRGSIGVSHLVNMTESPLLDNPLLKHVSGMEMWLKPATRIVGGGEIRYEGNTRMCTGVDS